MCMWWLMTTAAWATPSEVCPGSCSAGGDPCGGPEDCAPGDGCAFDEACLPGGAPMILRVVPGSEVALGAFDDYAPQQGAVDGDAFGVGAPLAAISDPTVSPAVAIAPDTRYVLRFELEVDPNVRAMAEVVVYDADGAQIMTATRGEQLEQPWTTLDVPFTTPAAAASVATRLYAVDPDQIGDAARFRGLALLELRPASTWVRARLPAGVGDPLWFVPAPSATAYGGAVIGTLAPVAVPGDGSPSEWVDLGVAYPSTDLTVGFTFQDDAGLAVPVIGAEVDVAWDPSAGVVDTLVFDDPTGAVGFYVPGVPPDPLELAAQIRSIGDVLTIDRDLLGQDPTWGPISAPTAFGSTTVAGWDPHFGDWPTIWPELDFLADLGINGVWQDALPADTLAHLDEDGMTYRTTPIGPPLVYTQAGAPYPYEAGFDSEMDAYFDEVHAAQSALDATAGHRDHLLLDMADELNGARFEAGEGYDAAFRAWVQARVCPAPFDPATCPPRFGLADWADLHAATAIDGHGMTADAVDCVRPRDDELPAACAAQGYVAVPLTPESGELFWWQMQWWTASTGELYGRTREWLEARAGDPPWIAPQLGMPMSYMTLRTGTELQGMYGAGAANAFWGEGFLSNQEFCHGQTLGAIADWIDGNMDPYGISTRAILLHPNRGHGANRAATLAARGVDWIHWYAYGPHQLMSDGNGGFGPASADMMREIQRANAFLAATEGVLAGADAIPSGVAIVAAQSDPLWWDVDDVQFSTRTDALSEDDLGVHRALTHGHRNVRFLVEDRLTTDLGPDTSVLFVTRKHLSQAAFEAIRGWVSAGGALVVVGELPTYDAFGMRVPDRQAWFGFGEDDLDVPEVEPLLDFTVDWPGIGALAMGEERRSLRGTSDNGEVVATYADNGEPAVVDLAIDAGRVRMIGFALGAAYRDSVGCARDTLPMRLGAYPPLDDFDAAQRAAVLDAVADVPSPFDADDPLLEVTPVTSPAGTSVVLVNYDDHPLVGARVVVPGDVHALIAGADLAVDAEGAVYVDVDGAEVLTLAAPLAAADPPPEEPARAPALELGCARTGGCATGGARWGAWWALLGLARVSRRRV